MWKRFSRIITNKQSDKNEEENVNPEKALQEFITKVELEIDEAKNTFLKVKKHEGELHQKLTYCIKIEEELIKKASNSSDSNLLKKITQNKHALEHYSKLYAKVQQSTERLNVQLNSMQAKLEIAQTKKVTLLASLANKNSELEISKFLESDAVFQNLEEQLYKTTLEINLINGTDNTDLEIEYALQENNNKSHNIEQIKKNIEQEEFEKLQEKALEEQKEVDKQFNRYFINSGFETPSHEAGKSIKNALLHEFISEKIRTRQYNSKEEIENFFKENKNNDDNLLNSFFDDN